MRLLTLSEAKSTIARVLGMCSTDSRVTDYINEAVQRLLPRGKWVGTYGKYRICCSTNWKMSWPRYIETIEQIAICSEPGTLRSPWFEFLGDVGVLEDDDSIGKQFIDQGMVVVHTDPAGANQRIRVYCDSATDAGNEVLVKYIDAATGNKVYTLDGATWIEGELITTVAPPNYALSTYTVAARSTNGTPGIYGVVKPTTNQPVRLYCYDTVALTQYEMAVYEPTETVPVYRRSIIAGLADMSDCDDDEESVLCTSKYVDVIAKKRYIPVSNDNDVILIGNLPALKDEVMSIRKLEQNLFNEAKAYEASAIAMLQAELDSHIGDGQQLTIKVEDGDVWGGATIENVL